MIRFHSFRRTLRNVTLFGVACCLLSSMVLAQSVCLPAPRLLTTQPMGGKAGTQFEVTISGEHLEELGDLVFSDSRITAAPKLDAAGKAEPNKYVVSIAADCPLGLHESRVMSRLGLSSSRIFSVGTLAEVSQKLPNQTVATAMDVPVNSVCNATISARAVDHYRFEAKQGQRILVDCATRGIDSKLDAVVIIADAMGRDLLVERRGGALDFKVPADGKYIVKVHELTFKGGQPYYYRLAVQELPPDAPIVRQPSTSIVSSFSWPPTGLPQAAATNESEPNNERQQAQKIALPCDIAGGFFPAADVDVFEFEAKKGEVWWVEVASERLGRPTDPSILVQHVKRNGDQEALTDVAEFSDIPSPVKVSSNGYAYDGPPYNAGTADILGKLTIQEDGLHRLQITDLFGGTRNDPRNVYRLVIRQAAPDFALVAWAQHMELRNGDRNALSKPISLRGGSTMALEVIAIRRDGFDGDIELAMENLPEGMTANGLKIPAGQSRGMMLVTTSANAPRAFASANFFGRAKIGEATVTRPCRLASFAWPIPDSWGEIPSPRLMMDVPVSIGGFDLAPITIGPVNKGVIEAKVGEKLTIPLVQAIRSEFSAATMQLKPIGAGFERAPAFDVSLTADSSQAVLDLAALKTPPGDYLIAFQGNTVAKYRHRLDMVAAAEESRRKAAQEIATLEAEAKKLAEAPVAETAEKKLEAENAVKAVAEKQKVATATLAAAMAELTRATQRAQPTDIVDIVVSEPITIRVKSPESK